jgi:hypothetical protein
MGNVKFSELTDGELFLAYGSLWTKLDEGIARRHPKAAIELGERGFGYHGSICSFEATEIVEFVSLVQLTKTGTTGPAPEMIDADWGEGDRTGEAI